MIQTSSPLCPIAKLPADILTEIFQTTCESTQSTDKPITPLLFGGICKDWRRTAWSTPLLWSTVSINISKRRPSQVHLLRQWLLRAQSALLSIYLTLDKGCKWTSGPSRAVFELLFTRAGSWRIFDCVVPKPMAGFFDMLEHAQVPSLTSLSLRASRNYPTFPTVSLVAAPRLERIELSWFDLTQCNLDAFPLEQLRFFQMKNSVITDVQGLALLRCACVLQECCLDSIDYHEDSPPSLSPTLHTQLEQLYVENPSLFFLDNLILPKLRFLTAGDIHSDVQSPFWAAISSLVSRSSCHLEELNLACYLPFKDDVVITLLESLPSLTHLLLASSASEADPSDGLTDKLVSRLRPLDHASCLLPRLTLLVYEGPMPCDSRLLVDMLSERWHHSSGSNGGQGVSRLIGAHISVNGQSHKDTLDDVCADIDMLVDEGMEVEIRLGEGLLF